MNLFDRLVTEALKKQSILSPLRMVVEKELLHHDILQSLSQHQLLKHLTFIGGTCLRACYGGVRLSEDLDFTGGAHFSRASLSAMGQILTDTLAEKYGLQVAVSDPIKDTSNVSTWKIKIQTRPKQKHLPAQRINIDICSVPSYEKKPMLLLNPYGIDMGTSGLIIQAESREEIYTDKLIAFALRPNRLKYRDLWDIVWLHQQGLKPNIALLPKKLHDRKISLNYFLEQFNHRQKQLASKSNMALEFETEMRRFLPASQITEAITTGQLWSFILYLMEDLLERHILIKARI